MLRRLSGRTHVVYTGVSLQNRSLGIAETIGVRSEVTFKPLDDDTIDRYFEIVNPLDKAGAYAVQGVGAYLAEEITGSYTNIVGLPLCQVIEMMQEMGATDILPF